MNQGRARRSAARAQSPSSVGRVIVLLLGLAACAPEPPAAYSSHQCRRVSLIDQATGKTVRGAEDLALDDARGRLFIGAYDRRAADKAVRNNAPEIPEGGVYAVLLDQLRETESVEAAPVAQAGDAPGGVRPHGLAYDEQADEIVFINRGYQKIDGRWRLAARLEQIGSQGAIIIGPEAETRCRANDLIRGADGLLVSFDHAACGWRALIEDAFTLRRSGVALASGSALFDAAAHANGLAPVAESGIALAATREKALLMLERTSAGYAEAERIAMPGGPDNLTAAGDGAIVAALHPSLIKYGLSRRFGWGRAPSRIVRVDVQSGAVEKLFDDPRGRLFSGATVAVEADGLLILGSALDEGLLVCAAKA